MNVQRMRPPVTRWARRRPALSAQHGQGDTETPLGGHRNTFGGTQKRLWGQPQLHQPAQPSPSHKDWGLSPSVVAIPRGSFWFVNPIMFIGRMKFSYEKSVFLKNPISSVTRTGFSNQFLFPLLQCLFPAKNQESIRDR